ILLSRTQGVQPMKTSLLLMVAAAALAAPPTYKVVNKIKVGGGVRWDYAFVDSANHRLYVSHGTQTEVIDTSTDKLVGTIPDTKGVHGIAVANDLARGFTSDGGDNDVTVFDLAAGKVLATPAIGGGTDGVAFDDGYAFSANGADGTITMVGETSPGKFTPVATIQTTRGARTIASDQKAHKLYLPAAEYGPAGDAKDGKKGRPQPLPDTFQILVVGR